jgi:hypothetical protein
LSAVKVTDITFKHGLAARKAVAQVGAGVFYLAPTGVFRVSQVIQDRIQSEAVAVSDPIEPLFRARVIWAAAAGAVAAVLGEYYFLALPFDGATTNGVVLVYNTTTNQWEGWHEFAGLEITDLVLSEWDGTPALWAVDRTHCQVARLYAGSEDVTLTGAEPIETRLKTRGYLVGTADSKVFMRAEISSEQWNTAATPATLSVEDSGGRTKALHWEARVRTKYERFGQARYDLTNVNDDHGADGRGDYAILPSDNLQLHSGVVLERKAPRTDRAPIGVTARWISLVFEGAGGRCDLTQCAVEARQVGRTSRPRT